MAISDRIRLKNLITMDDEEFASLVDRATGRKNLNGATMVRILELARKRRMMTPPRRPRGEKPQTTIRVQAKQIHFLTERISNLLATIEDKNKVIAGYDAQLGEANDAERVARNRCAEQAAELASLQKQLRFANERRAFLEGYYAKSKETSQELETVLLTRRLLAGHQPNSHAARCSRDQAPVSDGRRGGAALGEIQGAPRFAEGSGQAFQGQPVDDKPYSPRRPVEHVKITGDGDWMNP
jgi:hypothetical protein